jgi:hypothetical protein
LINQKNLPQEAKRNSKYLLLMRGDGDGGEKIISSYDYYTKN